MPERYKLLVGMHIGADLSEEPVVSKNSVTGVETKKYPSRTWNAAEQGNNIVESETDLVAKHGAEKFAYMGRLKKAKKMVAEKHFHTPNVPPEGVVPGFIEDVHADKDEKEALEKRKQTTGTTGKLASHDDDEDDEDDEFQRPEGFKGTSSTELPDRAVLQRASMFKLRQLAKERNVDVAGLQTKEQVIAALCK